MPEAQKTRKPSSAADVMFELGMVWGDQPHVFGVIHNTIRNIMVLWGGFSEAERKAATLAIQQMTYHLMLTAVQDSTARIARLHPNDFIPVLINDSWARRQEIR